MVTTQPPLVWLLRSSVACPICPRRRFLIEFAKILKRLLTRAAMAGKCSLSDVMMSGLAVFSLKFPSLLKFDEQRNEARIRANLKSLFRVEQAPCDTQLRSVCDQVNPAEIRSPFIHINPQLYTHQLLGGSLSRRFLSRYWWDRAVCLIIRSLSALPSVSLSKWSSGLLVSINLFQPESIRRPGVAGSKPVFI